MSAIARARAEGAGSRPSGGGSRRGRERDPLPPGLLGRGAGLARLHPAAALPLQRAAGNAAVAAMIQRQGGQTSATKEEKKAEAKSTAEELVGKALDAAREKAPEAAADAVKGVVSDKLTGPALKRMDKGGADPDKVADARAAADKLQDLTGYSVEWITTTALDGWKIRTSLADALAKKLKPKVAPSFTPSLDLQGCSVSTGMPSATGPLKLLSDPSGVGAKWKFIDGKCTFAGGGRLSFSGTVSAKGFLDQDFAPRYPTSYGTSLKIEYKGGGLTFGASYKASKDPDVTGVSQVLWLGLTYSR